MNVSSARQDLEVRAAAALRAVLAEVSTIKVREIRHESSDNGRDRNLMAYVNIFGNNHTIVCEVQANGQPGHLRSALAEPGRDVAQLPSDATRVIIAPYLSPEAQALCKEIKAGFVDLEGNARLALGEVFILKQTLPQREQHRVVAAWPNRSSVAEKSSAAKGPRSVSPHRTEEQAELVPA